MRGWLYARAMRRLLLPLLLLAALWSGAWFYLTGMLRDRFEATVAAARANGWVVTAGAPSRAGFPLRAAIVVPDVTGSGGTALPGAGGVHASRLVLALAPAHPTTLAIALPDGFEVLAEGGAPIAVRARRLVGVAPLVGPPRVSVEATDLVAARAAGAGLAAAHARLWLAPRGPDLGFRVAATDVRLPPGDWPLGPRIASVLAVGTAGGALAAPPANGVRGTVGWLQAWRDRGGSLTLTRLALGWGPLSLSGEGSAALDAALQPQAQGRLAVRGYEEALAAMAKAGFVAPGSALAAGFALGLLARPGKDGAPPEIDVTAALRGGRLTIGGVDLGPVAKLSWPATP